MMDPGGYNVKNATVYDTRGPLKSPDLSSLICCKCKLILRDPRQVITCGHLYCKQCIEWLTSGSDGPYICPEDQENFVQENIRNDKACSKEIEALSVDCPNDCTWNGKLLDMEEHVEECPQRILPCSQGCGKQIPRRYLDKHISSLCSKRPSPCQFCRKNIPWDIMEDHITTCEECPTECHYCNKHLLSKKLSHHLEQECDECDMTCLKSGCQFKGKRSEMIQHISSTHSIQMLGLCEELKAENQILRNEVAACIEENKRLRIQLYEVQSEGEIDSGMRGYSADQAQQCTDIEGAAEPQWPVLHQESNYRPQSQPATHEKINQSTCMKTSSLTSLTDYAVAIEEVSLRDDVTDVKATNGLFVWKILNVHQRYREAVEGKAVSLYSPPFYTSLRGYRVRICTYLNGDGDGKSTHISVFFFIMHSEHDDELLWPFKDIVRFTLVNQTNPAASITEAFVPDLHSPSFQKPRFRMNIASGFPKFAPTTVLEDENFTGDNTLTIHCQVNPNGLALL